MTTGKDSSPLSEAAQQAFFDQILERAGAAERAVGSCEVDLALAGTVIRLVFAGPMLREALLPAVAHLRIERGERADAVFHIWESEASGVANGSAPFAGDCLTDRGDIWTMMSRRVRSCYRSAEGVLSLLDLDRGEGVFWVRSAGVIPAWVRAAPFLTLFHWWIEAAGGHLLHGAAVGTDEGGVLITGAGGTGKSTTALACLNSGLRYVGDDYVAVTLDPPTAHSIYRSAKLGTDRIARAGRDDPQPTGFEEGDKAVVMVPADHPGLSRSLPITAVLTPEFDSSHASEVIGCDPSRALDATCFTTIAQLPHAGAETISFVERLLDRVACGVLRLGCDVTRVPATLAEFIASPQRLAERRPVKPRSWPSLVSVVIPVFNGAPFLADAVGSILRQNFPAIEIIVVDDGSQDDLEHAVRALSVPVVLVRQNQLGPSAARNRGIAAAKGDAIGFLDVDDLWPGGSLRSALDALAANPVLDLVTGYGQLTAYEPTSGEWVYVDDARAGFPHYISAALFRPIAFEKIGLFDERLSFGEDTDWFLRAKEAGLNIHRLEKTSLLVRRHSANMTRGQNGPDLLPLRILKNVLDRRRARCVHESGANDDQGPHQLG